jgi:hypothetical protein
VGTFLIGSRALTSAHIEIGNGESVYKDFLLRILDR